VQEYVDGKSLAQLVQEGRHFSEPEALRLALKLCDLLQYLHSLSPPIVHRDLKPGNIILSAEDRLFLMDFGAVKDSMLTDYAKSLGTLTVVGTYGYMPIEQIEGRAQPQSDLYALGMTLIHLLSHKEPIDIEKKGLELDFRPHVNISDNFAGVIKKLIAPDWQQRYQSAADVKADIERLERKRPIKRKAGRVKRALLVMATICVVFGLAGYIAFQMRSSQLPPAPPPPAAETDDVPALNENAPINAMQSAEESHTAAADSDSDTPAPLEFDDMPLNQVVPETEQAGHESITRPVLEGRLLFAGRPITDITTIKPTFWFRNEDTGKAQEARVTYENGRFLIYGLPPGNFGVSINIDSNAQNPWSYPGDFRSWQPFTVTEGSNPEMEVSLLQLIHMTAPQDNNVEMEQWGAECMQKITWQSPVTFRWESVGEDVDYEYRITRMACDNNYNSAGTVVEETTMSTELTIPLAPSLENECYGFHLYAYQNDQRIGMLMTHGSSGYGWDYRFRVR
jgi:hypothetical protein